MAVERQFEALVSDMEGRFQRMMAGIRAIHAGDLSAGGLIEGAHATAAPAPGTAQATGQPAAAADAARVPALRPQSGAEATPSVTGDEPEGELAVDQARLLRAFGGLSAVAQTRLVDTIERAIVERSEAAASLQAHLKGLEEEGRQRVAEAAAEQDELIAFVVKRFEAGRAGDARAWAERQIGLCSEHIADARERGRFGGREAVVVCIAFPDALCCTEGGNIESDGFCGVTELVLLGPAGTFVERVVREVGRLAERLSPGCTLPMPDDEDGAEGDADDAAELGAAAPAPQAGETSGVATEGDDDEEPGEIIDLAAWARRLERVALGGPPLVLPRFVDIVGTLRTKLRTIANRVGDQRVFAEEMLESASPETDDGSNGAMIAGARATIASADAADLMLREVEQDLADVVLAATHIGSLPELSRAAAAAVGRLSQRARGFSIYNAGAVKCIDAALPLLERLPDSELEAALAAAG